MANQKNFYQLGNLAFYNQEAANNANKRFFYFKTLLNDNYNNSRGLKYAQLASQAREDAKSLMSKNPLGTLDTNDKNSKALTMLKQAIEILEEGIEYEKQNEQKYIKEKLIKFRKEFNKTPLQKSSDFQKIGEILAQLDKGFDYLNFINLINVLLQGVENTKLTYDFEQKHIAEVNQRYSEAKDHFLEYVDIVAKQKDMSKKEARRMRLRSARRFDNAAKKTYLLNHKFTIASPQNKASEYLRDYMRGTQTIDEVISKEVTKQLQYIFNKPKLVEEIKNIIEKNYKINDWGNSREEIRGKIVIVIVDYMKHNLNRILKREIQHKNITKELEKYFEDYFAKNSDETFEFNIQGLAANIGQKGTDFSFLNKNINDQPKNVSNLCQALEKFYDKIINLEENNKKLNKEQIATKKFFSLDDENSKYSQLLKFIEALEKYSKDLKKDNTLIFQEQLKLDQKHATKRKTDTTVKISIKKNGELSIEGDILETEIFSDFLNIKQFNPKNLRSAITIIKRKITKELAEDIPNLLNIQNITQSNYDVVERAVEKSLGGLQIKINGATYSELKDALEENIGEVFASGKLKIKNDTITVTISHSNISVNTNLSLTFNKNYSNNFLNFIEQKHKEYEQKYIEAIQQDMQKISSEKKFTDYNELETNFFKQMEVRDTYIRNGNQIIEKIQQRLKNKEYSSPKQKAQLEQRLAAEKLFLEDLKNSLYISSTVKTFNNYQNNIGFIGGSIGATIDKQIENLNILFTKAGFGLTQEEIDWLIFASINNSSLSIFGKENEDLITTLLGSLAVFALFDEGGAELKILRNNILKKTKKDHEDLSTSGILHIYLLNGIYYPGSFVLQQALDNIKIIIQEIENEITATINANKNIQITSSISFNDLPNKNINANQSEINTNPWTTISNIALEKTQLNVVFLSGLLKVISDLNNKLGKVQI